MKVVSWWSAGITSALATKIALNIYGKDNVDIYYFVTGAEHEDNKRFLIDCEQWYGKHIIQLQSAFYRDPWDVAYKKGFIKAGYGALCTDELKRKLRQYVEEHVTYDHHVLGFDNSRNDVNRAIRFKEQYPHTNPVFPLIDNLIDKNVATFMVEKKAGIRRPKMYELGFQNNNCIGCFKGSAGYHTRLVKKHFPDIYEKNSKMERDLGFALNRKRVKVDGKWKKIPHYLDEMDTELGREEPPIAGDCGFWCDLEAVDITDKRTEKIMQGKLRMEDIE